MSTTTPGATEDARDKREAGQALVLFAFGVIAFCGFVAMSIDVGRYLWARTQMQSAVDSAALAAAQSMPSGVADAESWANYFWDDNNDFLESNSSNLQFLVSYPPGNKRVRVKGDADIPTWFARIFGVDSWHVSAQGDAEAQVLDIAVVLDISGSMCFTSYPPTESGQNYLMSPGRLTPYGGFAFPKLTQPIAAATGNSITIYLNDVGIFNSTNSTNNRQNFGDAWNSTTRYWQRDPDGTGAARSGMIGIGTELFKITALDAVNKTLTVTRAQTNNYDGSPTVKQAHAVNSEIWALRYTGANGSSDYCDAVSYYKATSVQNGPHQPFDAAISNAQYFVSLFDSAYDRIGVARYSTTGTISSNLTANFSSLNSSMDAILYPAGGTNIADGIDEGRRILNGPGKRANAVRVMVVLTDGIPNQYCSNGYGSGSCTSASSTTPSTCPASTTAITHAKNQATAAANEDIIVFWIGLGDGVLDCLLQEMAALGTGEYIAAPSIADLDDAFKTIAEKTHIALVD